MGLTDVVDSLLGSDSGTVSVSVFECQDCGETFESAKQPGRVACKECLSNDVEVVSNE